MKILITGANGMLGSQLVKKLLDKNLEVTGIGRGPCRLSVKDENGFSYHALDITVGQEIYEYINSVKPDVIIHAAAMTMVDECELNKIDCWNTNVTATRFIIDAARETGTKIILLSTDFVFDGLHGPYKEDDPPNPLNYYGSSKWGAEKAVQESGVDWTIVRTVLVLGRRAHGQRHNILTWVKLKLEEGEVIKVVDDQVRTPTYVEDLVDGIILILEKNAKGIYHISGKDTLTPYQIAMKTAEHLGLDTSLIHRADAGNFTQAAVRPPKTGFIIDKARRELNYEPHSFHETLTLIFPKATS